MIKRASRPRMLVSIPNDPWVQVTINTKRNVYTNSSMKDLFLNQLFIESTQPYLFGSDQFNNKESREMRVHIRSFLVI